MDTTLGGCPNAARCVAVFTRADQLIWKFDDGSEVVTDHDLSTDAGRHLFAQDAEKLGFGHRSDLVRIAAMAWVAGPGDGPFLQRPPG